MSELEVALLLQGVDVRSAKEKRGNLKVKCQKCNAIL
jgi:hypothetical protein